MTNRELIQRLLHFPMDAPVYFSCPMNYEGDPDRKEEVSDLWEDTKGKIVLE